MRARDEREGDQRIWSPTSEIASPAKKSSELAIVPEQLRTSLTPDDPDVAVHRRALTSTSGPPAATSTPPSSTSEVVSPLSDFASTKRREPGLTRCGRPPTRTDVDEASAMDADVHVAGGGDEDTRFAASAISTSPNTDLIVCRRGRGRPGRRRRRYSPPLAADGAELDVAARQRTLASRSTSSTWTSPDAVFTSTAPRRPVARNIAEAMFASTSDPRGARTRISYSSPLNPNRCVPRSRCPPCAARPSGPRGRPGSPRPRPSSQRLRLSRPRPAGADPEAQLGGSGVAKSYLTGLLPPPRGPTDAGRPKVDSVVTAVRTSSPADVRTVRIGTSCLLSALAVAGRPAAMRPLDASRSSGPWPGP